MKRTSIRSLILTGALACALAAPTGATPTDAQKGELATIAAIAPEGRPLRTGQRSCWDGSGNLVVCTGTGQDGELRKGVQRIYTDNGDGTVTDEQTGLMWEKLCADGSIHDVRTYYTWDDAFAVKVATLNSGGGFAGYTDWRVPNVNELQSLVNYKRYHPAVSPVFDGWCPTSCTVLTCSCTNSSGYWSSSTDVANPTHAWSVNFNAGNMNADDKTYDNYVRAVRGGS